MLSEIYMINQTLTAVLLALFAPRWVPAGVAERLERAEPQLRRFGPFAVAIICALAVWWVWGQLAPLPIAHDERSYLLQTEIFARGRWTVPSPPIPEFFEQPHVLVVPAVASKYPPGHALVLTLGTLVGFQALMPLVLTGLVAALLFILTTRVLNAWAALFACAFWMSAPIVLRFQPSYFSELTTTTLFLTSWLLLLEWRSTRRRRWLLLIALAIGWGAITRPLTMLAFSIPIGIVVLRDVMRLKLWRDFALACAIGVAVLGMLPLWSARTTGDWRLWPVERYRRDYMPYDKPGFTPDSTPPARQAALSAVLVGHNAGFFELAEQHRLDLLPQIVTQRALKLAVDFFAVARLPLLPIAIVGLFVSPLGQFAALSALVLFAAYMSYAHYSGWTIYYLDTAPIVAAITAAWVWRVGQWTARSERGGRLALVFATVVVLGFALPTFRFWQRQHITWTAVYRNFTNMADRVPKQPAIVFLRYSPRVLTHFSVVYNFADLNKASVWVVHDRGAQNAELLKLAPERTAYYFDEDELVRRRQ